MARLRLHAAGCALALVLTPIWGASATTVSFVWTGASSAGPVAGLGTSSVFVSGSDPATLTLEIQFDLDSLGLVATGVHIEFDTEPELDDELDIASYLEVPYTSPTSTLRPLAPGVFSSQESTSTAEGQIFGLEIFTLGTGPRNITLTFARIVFTTKPLNVATDGDDIFTTNERDPGDTLWADNSNEIHPLLIRASVNLIPEPASAALLGLGLGALAAAARGRGRRAAA